MYPIIFSIGRVNVYTHGLLMVLGVTLGGLAIYFLARKEKYDTSFLFDLLIYAFLGGLIGARMFYVIIYFHQFGTIKEALFIWYGGLVSFGGILGGLLTAYFILKTKRENIYQWFDIGAIGLMLGWAIGRIGCLLNGDSFGIINASKIAIWGRIPTQLFESAWTLLVAVGLYFIFRRKKQYNLPAGVIFFLGLAGYALGRFAIDFYRDETIFFLNLKAGQIGSIILIIFSAFMVYRIIVKRKELKWS